MRQFLSISACLLCLSAHIAQGADEQTAPSQLGNCRGVTDFRQYKIRTPRVNDPFWFIRWRKLSPALLAEVKGLEGKDYSFAAANTVSRNIEGEAWLPDTPDVRASFSYSDIALENCKDNQLDVVFNIFSAQVGSTLSTVFESRAKEKAMPSQALGVSDIRPKLQVAPEAGFDAARNFGAGGRLQLSVPSGLLSKLQIDGHGSPKSRSVTGALRGEFNSSTSWLGHADWRLDFHNSMQPVADAQISESRLALQFAGATKQRRGAVVRFGGSLNGGILQSSFLVADLDQSTLRDTRYTAAKLYGGVSGRANHQAYSVSYAMGLGSTGNAFHGDWRKHIGDVSYEVWLPFRDHHLFEWEQRLTAGGIQNPGKIPAAERFFGGNVETPFVDFDSWKIRANPVIRSIPFNRLARTASGIGGDAFFSYNSTIAATVWRKPIIPDELAKDSNFQQLLEAQVTSGRSVLQIYYSAKDSHFTAIKALLPDLLASMEAIKTAKATAEAAAPESLKPAFSACTKAWSSANLAVKFAVRDKPTEAFGWVKEMLPGGDNSLALVSENCGELVSKLKSAAIDTAALEAPLAKVKTGEQNVVSNFKAIDVKVAEAKAEEDFRFVDRTLKTITREMNISSISPVFLFDVGRIAPANTQAGGNRYAVGGGIRFTLVSTASFTLGYAVNPNRHPGEGRGALFFSLTTRNLFE
ncbi:MAG: hypothetical protein HY820_02125 [Acidobacteria bacterium]|nr:hypothetical protein [Acidobacteriota bacterium]